MVQMVVTGQFQTGQTALDVGITDLMVMVQDGETVLYASSGQTGGLTSFALASDGSVSVQDTALYNSSWADSALAEMSLIEVNGVLCVAVAGSGEDQLYVYDVNADGSLGNVQRMTGLGTEMSHLLEVSQDQSQTVYMADAGSGRITGYSIEANGTLTKSKEVADTTETYGAEVMAIASTSIKQSEYIISVSQTEKGVSAYRVENGQLINTGNAGVNEGLGIMTPTDMEMIEMNGRTFILVASAPNDGIGQSGAITVMELAQDGSLVDTDHIIDTGNTHFGNVQSLEVVQADDRTYVIAGGGDDGVTLFVMMPNGRLQLLGTVSGDQGLQNISTMAAQFNDGTLHLYVASELSSGVTEITVDVSNQGEIIEADHSGGVIDGSALDDILIGGAGNDSIRGGSGDDLLEDGLGVDTLHGGDGADLFILRSDFTHDVIQDFQPGLDRLDLSSWPMLYNAAQIGYTATSNGAILDWRGETLELISRDGQTISFLQVQAAILETADRVPDFSAYGGNDGDQEIEGTAINDAINAGEGHDAVNGFAGDDYIDAGTGNDSIYGDIGQDTLMLGAGDDYAEGGLDEDLIHGNDGADSIWAGHESDTIYGGNGSDYIRGEQGADLIYGGNDGDVILGDNGDDTIFGEEGNDLMRGGNGSDILYGGDGNDRLFGANKEDTIFGGDGDDRIRAGFQPDYLDGGAGNDDMIGGGGRDTLIGGEGNDTMEGNSNADLFTFEDNHGQDVILDFAATVDNEKLEFSALSTMNSYADVMAASVQQGAHVFIDTGNGNSILLENVLLSDLDVNDFVF